MRLNSCKVSEESLCCDNNDVAAEGRRSCLNSSTYANPLARLASIIALVSHVAPVTEMNNTGHTNLVKFHEKQPAGPDSDSLKLVISDARTGGKEGRIKMMNSIRLMYQFLLTKTLFEVPAGGEEKTATMTFSPLDFTKKINPRDTSCSAGVSLEKLKEFWSCPFSLPSPTVEGTTTIISLLSPQYGREDNTITSMPPAPPPLHFSLSVSDGGPDRSKLKR